MEILHPEVYEFHNKEIVRLQTEGFVIEPALISPAFMSEFP